MIWPSQVRGPRKDKRDHTSFYWLTRLENGSRPNRRRLLCDVTLERLDAQHLIETEFCRYRETALRTHLVEGLRAPKGPLIYTCQSGYKRTKPEIIIAECRPFFESLGRRQRYLPGACASGTRQKQPPGSVVKVIFLCPSVVVDKLSQTSQRDKF